MSTLRLWGVVALFSCLCLAGCQKGNLSGLVPCQGKVTFNGSPCAGAQIQFAPASAESGRTAIGRADSNGNFTMRTLQPDDGVYPGEYNVSITRFEFVGSKPEAVIEDNPTKEAVGQAQENKLPKKYANPQSSGLTISVPPGGKKDAVFELSEK